MTDLVAPRLSEIAAGHVADSLLTIVFADPGDIEAGISGLEPDLLDRLDARLHRLRDTIDDERTLRRLQRRRQRLRRHEGGPMLTPRLLEVEGEDG